MRRRPLLFRVRHFEPEIMICAVRWYLRYSLSYRNVQDLPAERSLMWNIPRSRDLQRKHLKPVKRSWRVDETYVRVKGE
jgi:transposase, IS6 family